MLDGGDHEVADIAGRNAARSRDESHGFPIATIESEGDADLFSVVADDLEPIGTPAAVAGIDCNPTVMPTFCATPAVPLQQQAVELHDPVNPLGVRRRSSIALGLTAEQRMNATIAVGRQIDDQGANISDEITVWKRRSPPAAYWSAMAHGGEMRSRNTDRVCNRAH
jgi:hypothetical protein